MEKLLKSGDRVLYVDTELRSISVYQYIKNVDITMLPYIRQFTTLDALLCNGYDLSNRTINKYFRLIDDSHLWPIKGKFNVTERAIRHVRILGVSGLEYCLALDAEIGRIVNNQI